MDPCELRLAKGDSAVEQVVDGRTPLFEFAIRSVVEQYDNASPEGQAAALEASAPIVARIKDQAVRHKYAVMLSGLLGYVTDTQFVVRRVSQLARWEYDRRQSQGQGPVQAPGTRTGGVPAARTAGSYGSAPAGPSGPRLDLRSPAHRVERELLKLALQHPHLVSPAFDAYGEDEFTGPPYAAVRRAIVEVGGVERADEDYLLRVREAAPDDTVRTMITELAVEPVMHKLPEIYAGDVLVRVRLLAVDRRVAQVHATQARLAAQGASHAAPEMAAVQSELWALQQYGQRLREQGVAAL
jgi:DNA primase